MRDRILDLLVTKQGEYVSGEELSKLLGITRAAIWKHINRLKEEGYRIESQTRLGHRLENQNGPLNKFQLMHGLGTTKLGLEIVVRREVTSTNDFAKELAKSGAAAGTVVVAEVQQGGKGRRGRQWVSPRGGIWLSVILRPSMELKDVASYTLLAGVAVARAINKVSNLQAGIKWPNDVLVENKKVGGILTEVVGEWQAVEFLVIGIGINANLGIEHFSSLTEATSLSIEAGKPVDIVAVIQEVLRQLERLEASLLSTGSNEKVLKEWRQLAVCLKCPVVIKEQNKEWSAKSLDIDSDGSLIVENALGQRLNVYSGDVSLRGKQGDYQFG